MSTKPSRAPSRCVFIGNIAYDATKEQLVNVFKEVGPILNFRMVLERETNKPRGFAFCEYKDEASALSAIRNLTGRELNGRALRVDFADNHRIGLGDDDSFDMPKPEVKPKHKGQPSFATSAPPSDGILPPPSMMPQQPPQMMQQQAIHPMQQQQQHQQQSSQLAPPMQAPPPQQQQQHHDPILAALSQVPRTQLFDAVAQMKHLVMTDPDRARQILSQNPMLAIVMLNIQFLLGMLKQPFLPPQQQQQQQPLPQTQQVAAPHQQQPPPLLGMPPSQQPQQQASILHPPPHLIGAPLTMQQQQAQQVAPPPHMQQQQAVPPSAMAAPSPIMMQQQQMQQFLKNINPQHLQQILSMTPQQVDKLPQHEKQQVILIQQHINPQHLQQMLAMMANKQ